MSAYSFIAICLVEYLGHLVSYLGVEPLPSKVAAILQWHVPRTTKVVREETFQFIRKKLIKAQMAMKEQADTHRRDVSYQPGDWVLLKLRPHRQTTAKGSQSFSEKLPK